MNYSFHITFTCQSTAQEIPTFADEQTFSIQDVLEKGSGSGRSTK